MRYPTLALACAAALCATPAGHRQAQAQDTSEQDTLEEIIVVGTRSLGRTALDSPVPVDAFSFSSMGETGQTEVGRMLQSLAPSFNFSSSTISDGTDALRPATLRGLGPDQTLVLVNGKRRHGSALVHVNQSVGRGTAGTDLNAIPASAIKRIEVLRDGAAAQYGSDAIAGVINIVLHDHDDGGRVGGQAGQFTDGDGETWVTSYSQGFRLGNGGFINATLEYRDRGRTNRAGLAGDCIYADTCVTLPDGTKQTTDPREIVFDRKNFRIGDADSEQVSAVLNLGLPVSTLVEAYGFATWSERENTSGGFYRNAGSATQNPRFMFDGTPVNGGHGLYPDGFLPLINTDIKDLSTNAGVRGEFGDGWTWDVGAGWAENTFEFEISNSLNASMVSATGTSPTSARAGDLRLTQLTFDADVFKDLAWGSIAFGAAYREEGYELNPGEVVSFADFNPDVEEPAAPPGAAGIQVFPGFRPENKVDEDRDSVAAYLEVDYDAIDRWLFSGAVRFEDYSDFGSTFNAKAAAAFQATQMLRLRGSVSTGFRAPSLQQQFFNSTSTQFVTIDGESVPQERGTFRNDSAVAQAIGIPQLKEETARNASVGFVLVPADAWTITADYYRIEIDDRIVISGSIGTGLDPELDAALASANANSAQFFLNAADTTTEGVDLVVTHSRDLLGGDLSLSLAANYTDTSIDSVRPPEALANVPGIAELVFPSLDQSILEEWQPHDRVNLTGSWDRGVFGLTVAVNRYGEYTVEEGIGASVQRQTYGAKTLVDLQFRYAFTDRLLGRIGGYNIFDITPDRNNIGQARGGRIIDGEGNVIVDSPGVFQYSRRSAPFGFNGAHFYAGLNYDF
ncbi:MAG TPA: TonB-dependent receptor [Gammaproteobacteria bacterium]|nr:TonB-dependent receptor [Gammaproteobacteria bacterium]